MFSPPSALPFDTPVAAVVLASHADENGDGEESGESIDRAVRDCAPDFTPHFTMGR